MLPRAINAVPLRILLFYVVTVLVLMSIFPWPQIGGQGKPFVQISTTWGWLGGDHPQYRGDLGGGVGHQQ